MKTYVLMVSEYFQEIHPKVGLPTFFADQIMSGDKIHTIRENYDWWKKRIDEVNECKAFLSIRYWTKSPYNSKRDNSKQYEYKKLYAGECGIQKAEFYGVNDVKIDGKYYQGHLEQIAQNDGLSYEDFIEWFRHTPAQPMAIIHFTNFKY